MRVPTSRFARGRGRRAASRGRHGVSGQIAHMNWARLKAPWDDPAVGEFVGALDRVNAVAERSPGFVWRMPNYRMEFERHVMDDWGPADRLAVTISVWETVEALDHFVHETVHGRFLKRRAEWFEVTDETAYVLWPIAAGHRPSVAEAAERRALYRRVGASPEAFDFAFAREMAR